MKTIYFLGIGGIGMSALARYFNHEGWSVAGYDRTPSPLTTTLTEEGIEIHYDDDPELIPLTHRNPQSTKVIYTPALPPDHAQLRYFRENNYQITKRAQALGLLSKEKWTMAVAGTHGKTSTTTMTAWFNTTGAGQGSAFLGGVSKNFGSNMVLGPGDRLAVEADEFDRSFLQLTPQAAVITSNDPDHLDIYGNGKEFAEAFAEFANQVSQTLILNRKVTLPTLPTTPTILRYSLDNPKDDYYAKNIELDERGYYRFDIVTPKGTIPNCTLGIPGLINVENCIGAVALVDQRGFDPDKLREGIRTYRGVARRFDLWINTPQRAYMDDYAHHPTELSQMIHSVRRIFPGRHLTLIFQPHLYSRTRDFADEFAAVLSHADHLVLLPIYPAREQPIEGVDSQMLLERSTAQQKILIEKEELLQYLSTISSDVVVTAGAGDIDRLCPQIAELYKKA